MIKGEKEGRLVTEREGRRIRFGKEAPQNMVTLLKVLARPIACP